MIRAFNLRCNNSNQYKHWEKEGEQYLKSQWPEGERDFGPFIEGGLIDGSELKSHWFSEIEAHVFISHSHADKQLAVGLAGYLHSMGLRPFVDSLVWGDCNKLINAIDQRFCWNDDTKTTYNYKSRNYSTSHVHMMLASALAETIDRCELVIFLNTPNSIQASDSRDAPAKTTASPWIYHELITTQIVRPKSYKNRPLPGIAMDSLRSKPANNIVEASFQVKYKAPTGHLTKLTIDDLENFNTRGKKGIDLLDQIYLHYSALPS